MWPAPATPEERAQPALPRAAGRVRGPHNSGKGLHLTRECVLGHLPPPWAWGGLGGLSSLGGGLGSQSPFLELPGGEAANIWVVFHDLPKRPLSLGQKLGQQLPPRPPSAWPPPPRCRHQPHPSDPRLTLNPSKDPPKPALCAGTPGLGCTSLAGGCCLPDTALSTGCSGEVWSSECQHGTAAPPQVPPPYQGPVTTWPSLVSTGLGTKCMQQWRPGTPSVGHQVP